MTDRLSIARLTPRAKRPKKRAAAPVEIQRVHPDVLRRVKELPGYDPRLLVVVSETEVILRNNRK